MTLLEKQKLASGTLTTQESNNKRFNRPGAAKLNNQLISPIVGKERTEEEENVTAFELEEDMKVLE